MLGFLGGYCASTVAFISAHQSIGVPQPLKEFGTEEQKRKYLPRLAKGEISAFALTEPGVGSDPARMTTVATPSADGKYYMLNGDKLWCTNVTDPKTTLIAVLARTPDKVLPNGKSLPQISCFVVETAWPGVERVRRSRFMGLRGIANGVIAFKDVKVPAENLIGKPGEGLKIALATLNVGRLGIPAAAIGGGMALVDDAKWWTSTRQQWGQPVGKHQAVAKMISGYMAQLFAMKAMVNVACAFADHKNADIRLEAAAAKYWCSETLWKMYDDYLQVRGGRGYEQRQVAVRARRAPDRGRDGPARRAHQPHLRGLVAGHAPDHGARGARHPLQAGHADPAAEARPEGHEERGDDEGGRLLRRRGCRSCSCPTRADTSTRRT